MPTPLVGNTAPCPTCAFLSLQPDDPAIKRTARVEQLLRRNHPPLEAELADFRLVVEKSPGIIHDLDQKIVQAKELMDLLVRARAQAESHLADAKSLLHPMRSLPNELVAEIFSHCIDVHFDLFPEGVAPRQLAYKMALFIERSKGLPLSLFITAEPDIEDHPIIPILEASIPRWKHFSTNHLVLVICEDDDSDVVLDIFNPTNAPALRILDADLDSPFRVSLPLSSLTHLNDFAIIDGAFELLQKMSTPSEDIKVSLPKLLHLSVTETAVSTSEAALDKLFSTVDMPSLCDLRLNFRSIPNRLLHLPKLTKLHISCGMCQHSDLMHHILRFLLQTPHVENFRISDSSLTPEFISGLKVSSMSSLPRLRVLDISDNRCGDSLAQNMSVIYDMLEGRCLDVVAFISSDSHTPTANAMDVGIQSTSLGEASYPRHVRLEMIRVPRWLYFKNDERWKVIYRSLKVECGITMDDDD
ncbi:hypothetical protein BDZ89DRAFT_1061140 [Hymenopellis radicata]|nr:hypothetical protein BDZ89DRAFT_1061140 [Hymenopellis radicata]